MNPLKKFWEKRKADSKFKKAGTGHRLDTDPSPTQASSSNRMSDSRPTGRTLSEPRVYNDAQAAAAEAALKRITADKSKDKSINLKLSTYKQFPSDFMETERRKVLEEMNRESVGLLLIEYYHMLIYFLTFLGKQIYA